MQIYAIRQVITAGDDFNGAAPTTEFVDTNGVRAYPTDTVGGLFDFSVLNTDLPISIRTVQLFLADATSWQIDIGDSSGDISVASGVGDATALYMPDGDLTLAPGQTLKVETSGASAAMYAVVVFAPASIGGF
jgi:hypothetical protein